MSDQRTAAIVRAYISNLRFTYGEYSEAMARLLEKNYKQAGRYVRKTKPPTAQSTLCDQHAGRADRNRFHVQSRRTALHVFRRRDRTRSPVRCSTP